MARTYCEDFKQPTDMMTGQPIPGTPKMCCPMDGTNRPGYGGYIVMDDEPDRQAGGSRD